MGFFHWIDNAIKSVGKAAGSLAHVTSSVTGAIGSPGVLSAIGGAVSGVTGANVDLSTIGPALQEIHQVSGTVGQVSAAMSKGAAGLAQAAAPIVANNPIFAAARQSFPQGVKGFDAAVSLMQHPGTTQDLFDKLRASLSPLDQKGFDAAVSAHIGMVAHPIPADAPPAQQAAYAITLGLQGATPDQKSAIVGTLAQTEAGQAGVAAALDKVSGNLENQTLITKIVAYFGMAE